MRNPNRIITSISTKGQNMSILKYHDCDNIDIQFEDDTIIKNKTYYDFIRGKINNPNLPRVCNKGFMGQGVYVSSINGKSNLSYMRWKNMLHRCYSENYHLKFPTYIDCEVCDEWLNFQNFAKWFEDNYIEGFELDKDIIIKGNKIYSPETCCFVPKEINYLFVKNDKFRKDLPIGVIYHNIKGHYKSTMSKNNKSLGLGTFTNVLDAFNKYKIEKELYIKEIADIFKELISIKTYNALYNYKIEIED
jgi:hypothetical protein